MERFDRHLTNAGCITLSMQRHWIRPCVFLIIRIQSHIVFPYVLIIVPTFNVTPNDFYEEATHISRDASWIIFLLLLLLLIIIDIILITIITISIIIIITIIITATITIIIITTIIIIIIISIGIYNSMVSCGIRD